MWINRWVCFHHTYINGGPNPPLYSATPFHSFVILLLHLTYIRIFTVSFIVACSSSSEYTSTYTYRCDRALSSSSGRWISDNDGTSAWIRVEMSDQKNVTKLEIKARCTNNDQSNAKSVRVEFDDGSSQLVRVTVFLAHLPPAHIWTPDEVKKIVC